MTPKRGKMGADAGSKIFPRTAAEDLAEVTGGAGSVGARDASREQERESLITTSYRLTQAQINWLRMEGARRAELGGRADASRVLRELVEEAMRKQGSK